MSPSRLLVHATSPLIDVVSWAFVATSASSCDGVTAGSVALPCARAASTPMVAAAATTTMRMGMRTLRDIETLLLGTSQDDSRTVGKGTAGQPVIVHPRRSRG